MRGIDLNLNVLLKPMVALSSFSGSWTISGTSLDLIDPLSFATAEAEHIFLEAPYDEYAASNDRVDVFCGAAVLTVRP